MPVGLLGTSEQQVDEVRMMSFYLRKNSEKTSDDKAFCSFLLLTPNLGLTLLIFVGIFARPMAKFT